MFLEKLSLIVSLIGKFAFICLLIALPLYAGIIEGEEGVGIFLSIFIGCAIGQLAVFGLNRLLCLTGRTNTVFNHEYASAFGGTALGIGAYIGAIYSPLAWPLVAIIALLALVMAPNVSGGPGISWAGKTYTIGKTPDNT